MIFDVPRTTTAVRDSVSGVNSAVIYNVDYNRYEYYNGSSWETLLSSPYGSDVVLTFNGREGNVTFLDSDVASLGDFTASGTLTVTNSVLLGPSSTSLTSSSSTPNVSGVSGAVGSLLLKSNGTLWVKYGANSTDWTPVNTYDYTNEPTGFVVDVNGEVDRTSSVISFDNGSRTLSVSPNTGGGYNSFSFFCRGKLYTKSTTQSVPILNNEGLHYFYFDGDGVLRTTSSFSLDIIYKEAYVAYVYWNSTSGTVLFVADERHGCVMDGHTHARIHQESGAVYVSGMALTSFSVDGNASSESHETFAVNGGVFRDEDIRFTLDSVGTDAPIPVYYRDGTNWRKGTPTLTSGVYPRVLDSAGTPGRVAYNQNVSGSYTRTPVSNNSFVCYHVVATNIVGEPYVLVMGTNEYGTKNEAQTGAITEISTLSGLPFVEVVFIGTVLYTCKTSGSNAYKAAVVSVENDAPYVDWRFRTTLNPSTASVNSHNSLGGINGTYPYYHSDQPISTTDSVSFAGLTTGSLTVTGTSTLSSVNLSSNLVVSGTSTFNSVNLTGNLTVGGNLTVNGTTTTVNSTVTNLQDPIVVLGQSPASVDDNKDRGVAFNYNSGGPKVGFFGYDDSTGQWTFVPDATVTSEVVSGDKGTLDARLDWSNLLNVPSYLPSSGGTLSGSLVVNGTLNVTGTSTLSTVNLSNANVSNNLSVTGTSTLSTVNFTSGVVSSNLSVSGVTTVSELRFASTTNSTASGTLNDVSVTNSTLVFSPSGTLTVTGFANGSTGEVLYVLNVGTADLVLANNSSSSTLANRLTTGSGSDVTVKAGSGVVLQYNSFWRLTGGTGGGGGTPGTLNVTLNLSNYGGSNPFVAGEVVTLDSSGLWQKALSNNSELDTLALVVSASGTSLVLQYAGEYTGLSGLVAGSYYYLSDTVSGALTSSPALYNKKVLRAVSTTSGYLLDRYERQRFEERLVYTLTNGAEVVLNESTYTFRFDGYVNNSTPLVTFSGLVVSGTPSDGVVETPSDYVSTVENCSNVVSFFQRGNDLIMKNNLGSTKNIVLYRKKSK